MKSCHILWISWNPVALSKILLDVMDLIKSFEISGFNELLLLFIKLCWISWNHMESFWILWNLVKIMWIYEIQQISVQIWWTSGGFHIMQILFRFTTDFICRFQGGLHYRFHCGFHFWILWITYEIHLIPYDRPGESEESHLNQLFLLISGGFHEID